jgi:uncharacterized protein YjbJ (UPF0337 family)
MGITDKITGRVKQAAGDLTGDERLREEGLAEERKGDAKQEADKADLRAEQERERADQLRREAARLETGGRSAGTDSDTDTDTTRRA